jgi:AraC-like DNA-binding protein
MKAQLEPIVASEATFLHTRRVAELQFNHPLHYHPEIELTYITRSGGTRLIGDHVGSFSEGDLCLIGENLPHLYTNTVAPTDGAEAEVLQFDRNFSSDFIDTTPEMRPFSKLLDQAKLGVVFDHETADRAGHLIRKLRRSLGFTRLFIFMELIQCLLSAKETHTLASPGYTGAGTPADSERMQVACRYILENFTEEIDHKALAAKVHLAPASFCRLFKRVTRKTCSAFINEVRLGHACRLLSESQIPIIDIAYACGFKNLSNFNRRFRESYSITPRDYRKLR